MNSTQARKLFEGQEKEKNARKQNNVSNMIGRHSVQFLPNAQGVIRYSMSRHEKTYLLGFRLVSAIMGLHNHSIYA